jgi:ankyrin repeat protein
MSVNEQDPSGYTPLQAAASWDRVEMVEYLISKGADVNLVDSEGDTALHYCENAKIAEVLVEHGADPLLRNKYGLLPIEKAYLDGHEAVVEFLKPLSPEINFEVLQQDVGNVDNQMIEDLLAECYSSDEAEDCLR